ncbi:MAG: hypothetical protein ACRD1H_19660, partial [Vicinamibacterales bacterium]
MRSDAATDLSLPLVATLPERRQSATLLSRQRQRILSVSALLATDAASVLGGFGIAYLIRFHTRWGLFYEHTTSPLTFYVALALAVTPLFLAVFACYYLYSERRPFDGAKEYPRIISAVTMAVMLLTLLSFLIDAGLVIARGWIVLSWIALLITVAVGRFVVRRLAYRLRRSGYLGTRVLLIGSGSDIDDLSTVIRESPISGLQIVGVIDAQTLATEEIEPRDDAPIMAHITATRADALIVSAASVPQTILSRIVREVIRTPTALHVIPGMYEILTTGVQAGEIGGLPLVTMNKARITGLDLLLKRLLDISATLVVLLATLPAMLLAAALVRVTSPGPILHRRR